jgi:hypothetical protein
MSNPVYLRDREHLQQSGVLSGGARSSNFHDSRSISAVPVTPLILVHITAWITGESKGTGAAVARELAKAGAAVAGNHSADKVGSGVDRCGDHSQK